MLACFSDRRQAAKKQAEKVERTISCLQAALASKEELHKQHEELVRLRRAEEELLRVQAVKCKQLRTLAGSLECESSSFLLVFISSFLILMFGCLAQLLRVRVRWRWR